MHIRIFALAALVALSLASWPGLAQSALEEVIVTGSLREENDIPGIFIKRRGDWLLLQVTVNNDSREEQTRQQEIHQTLRNTIQAATKQNGVQLGVVNDQGSVVPLDASNHEIELESSSDDTSFASVRIKKKIPANAVNPEQIVADLLKFVRQVKLVGRTTIDSDESVEISIIDPNQYRPQIIQRFGQEVSQLMGAIGPEYRVMIKSIDRPVKFSRVGPLDVALYIPYSYTVVPASMKAVLSADQD